MTLTDQATGKVRRTYDRHSEDDCGYQRRLRAQQARGFHTGAGTGCCAACDAAYAKGGDI